MCGIVGYVGNKEAYPILIGGLQRLEYRGYDSAGVATLVENGTMHIRRAKGKLENLRAMVGHSPLTGHIGIGHTRWATHGKPSEENAHPHKAGPVAVIHNGIVENFVELRAALIARGHKMKSETDTELISHLIEENLRRPMGDGLMGLTEAVRAAVAELRGSFSIVVMSETEPEHHRRRGLGRHQLVGLGLRHHDDRERAAQWRRRRAPPRSIPSRARSSFPR